MGFNLIAKSLKRLAVTIIFMSIEQSVHADIIKPTQVINLWSQEFLTSQRDTPLPVEQHNRKGTISHVANPRIQVYLPVQSNHKAILVISGGGYKREEVGNEGEPACAWLVQQGYTVFDLIYRLPNDNWHNKQVAFADGQRAIRLIRSHANQYRIKEVGVMGFSAGGHLAGMLAVSANHNFYQPQDDIDKILTRPDFVALIYPVVSMVSHPYTTQSYKQLLSKNATLDEETSLSIEQLVSKDTPPMFIAHAKDDPIAPVADSITLDENLKKLGVQQLLVLFDSSGHGWGMGKQGTPTADWPKAFQQWIVSLQL